MAASNPTGLTPAQQAEAQMLRGQGQQALQRRDGAAAKNAFERLAALEPGNAEPWLYLAMVHKANRDDAAQEQALFRALAIDSHDLMALIMRGNLFEKQGRTHEAAQAYAAVVTVAPPIEQVVEHLRPAVLHAREYARRQTQARGEFVERFIAEQGGELEAAEAERFRLSLDILFGRKKRQDPQPVGYYMPSLKPVEFFDRADFPWADEFESHTDAIRQEFLAVLRSDAGFAPYITYGTDQPLNQWAELNHSPRWSAFHLLKDGAPMPGNAERCPQTLAALKLAPQPVQAGRTPVAMFSLLKPRTRIPPHHGISNARLVTHLPLIVPPGCTFRVGNSVRQWQEGRLWSFDDTIEHEAWNDSDQLRVVLIFDVWNPQLNEAERRLISLMAQAENAFYGGASGGYAA